MCAAPDGTVARRGLQWTVLTKDARIGILVTSRWLLPSNVILPPFIHPVTALAGPDAS